MNYIAQTVFSPNDLQHFGVKGMKWGQRQAQIYNEIANMYERRMKRSTTKFGKSLNNNLAYGNRIYANMYQEFNKSKGLFKKAGALIGNGRAAAIGDARIKYHKNAAEYSTTKFGKQLHKAGKYNAEQFSKDAHRIHDSHGIKSRMRANAKAFKSDRMRVSGRKYNPTIEAFANGATYGAYGLGADAGYLIGKRISKSKKK